MHESFHSILELSLMMRSSRMGLSLDDIGSHFKVSRRSAERMRDTVHSVFELDELKSDNRQKRWRISGGTVNHLISYSAEELQELNLAIDAAEQRGESARVNILAGLRLKVSASLSANAQRKLEPDLEALMESEGLALRQGPKPKIAVETLSTIRRALMQKHLLKSTYVYSDRAKRKTITVEPHGLLFAAQPYLVAFEPSLDVPKLYALNGLFDVNVLAEPFVPRPEFSLRDFAERSFGTYQETPADVIWRFKPGALPPVDEFCFHPRQVVDVLEDGTTQVSFTCGGVREMAWHLFTWGDQLQSIEPPQLRKTYEEMLSNAIANVRKMEHDKS